MKKIYYLLLVVLLAGCGNDETPREGDIIFQTSLRNEASLVHEATQSPISHCGIIIEKEENNFYVLEASDHVRLIPLNKFIDQGRSKLYTIKRASIDRDTKIDYEKYIGCERDIFLRMDNNKYYNSELVYTIFKDQLGMELCTPRPVHTYQIDSIVGYLQSHRIHPQQPVIAPADLYNSPLLKTIRDTYKKEE